jgi:hypothetical protein
MKAILPILAALLFVPVAELRAQGVFLYSNISAPTRVGTLNGSLAGSNILAQMFAGLEPDSLTPVGPTAEHNEGLVLAGKVAVPGAPADTSAYVQMVAWDSTLWGTSLVGVPTDQLGRTDVVAVFLTTGMFPDVTIAPRFTQPAIVPPIPEPSVWALGVLALGALGIRNTRQVLKPYGGLELEK